MANFQDLITFVTGYEATYNPSKNTLKLPQLNALHIASQTSLADVVTKNTAYNNKVNERVVAFRDLKSLSTRLINALQTTDATKEIIADAKAFNKKMQGIRAKTTDTPADANAPASNTISTSQQSYDQQIQHLTGIVKRHSNQRQKQNLQYDTRRQNVYNRPNSQSIWKSKKWCRLYAIRSRPKSNWRNTLRQLRC